MKPLKRKVSITLDDETIQAIRVLAENSDRSFSQYINLILNNFLNDMLSYAESSSPIIPKDRCR